MNLVGFSESDLKKPLNDSKDDRDLGLCCPYSKATCLILYIYSMELGTPQLYAEVNRVARFMDLTHLREFGPFIKALGVISLRAQYFKNQGDQIKTGEMFYKEFMDGKKIFDDYDQYQDYEKLEIIEPLKNNMAGSFLLFRGSPMKKEWI